MLYKLGMSQSDFARLSGLNRAAISTYMKGQSLPNDSSIAAMEKALNLEPGTLIPGYNPSTSFEDRNDPSFDLEPRYTLTPFGGAGDLSLLRLNVVVPHKLALQILGLLPDDTDPSDGERNSVAA